MLNRVQNCRFYLHSAQWFLASVKWHIPKLQILPSFYAVVPGLHKMADFSLFGMANRQTIKIITRPPTVPSVIGNVFGEDFPV